MGLCYQSPPSFPAPCLDSLFSIHLGFHKIVVRASWFIILFCEAMISVQAIKLQCDAEILVMILSYG
jgi:hypothetical protein